MSRKIPIDFSDFWHPNTLEAKLKNPLYLLLSKRFDLEICDRPDFLVYSHFGVEFIRRKCARIYYTGENTRPNYALCDWAFSFDYSNDPRHFRLPLYFFYDTAPLLQSRDVEALIQQKSRFCAFVYSNAAARVRLKFLDKLSRYKQVDCGGKVRNNIGYRVPDKIAFLQAYKFSIAFENESYPGYTTEKLLEAFTGNTVPIYWGNRFVGREFNTAAFVNSHDFRNLDQVVDYVVELDRNEALYRQYLSQPGLPDNRPNRYMDETKILDRFEQIFTSPQKRPRAQTLLGECANTFLEPKRRRRERRRQRQQTN